MSTGIAVGPSTVVRYSEEVRWEGGLGGSVIRGSTVVNESEKRHWMVLVNWSGEW